MNDALKSLMDYDTFALLVAVTSSGDVVLRPIGRRYGASIIQAIEEINNRHPDSKMKLFYQDYDYDKYFKGIVPLERVFPWAGLNEEQLSEIKEYRRNRQNPSFAKPTQESPRVQSKKQT